MRNRTVLVVGSCGYLGNRLVQAARPHFDIVGVDALLWGQAGDPDTIVADASHPDFVGRVQDINPDAIVYLGAVAHDPDHQISQNDHWRHTYFAPVNLAAAFPKTPFVFASSLSSFQPASGLYPALKRLAEEDMLALDNVSVLRFGTLYGPTPGRVERHRTHLLLNSMVYSALVNKEVVVRNQHSRRPVLDLTHAVSTIIRTVHRFFAGSPFPGREAMNLFDTCGTVGQIGRVVADRLNCGLKIEEGTDTRDYGWGKFNPEALDLDPLVEWTKGNCVFLSLQKRKLVLK